MHGEEQVRASVLEAFGVAKRERAWPRVLEVRDAVDELSRWLSDDRQWSAQTAGHQWQSLIDEVVAALEALGASVRVQLGAVDAARELRDCKSPFGGKQAPRDPALRRRLERVVDGVVERASSAEVLLAAWVDLERSALAGEVNDSAARCLLSLARWLGHNPDSLVNEITRHLRGADAIWAAGTLHAPDPENTGTLDERFDAIREALRRPPWQTETIVWLRYRLARVDMPDAGHPVIDIGDDVRIFDGNWLRGCMTHPRDHHNLPPEALDESKWMLRQFCGLREADGEEPDVPTDARDNSIAYMRIVLDDAIVGRAVEVARTNAEAIASLGTLYGTSPEVWRLDESYVAIVEDREGGSSAPPSVEQPTYSERYAVLDDRTSRIIRDLAPQLAGHIPIRDPEVERAATLLGWLRGARWSPAPLRLVLCDRVVEAVCGWAGVNRPDAFVRDHLIPWWAYWRVHNVLGNAALALLMDRPGDPATWDEIVHHEPLQIRMPPGTISIRGVVAEVDWLLARVPENSPLAKQLNNVRDRTRTGQATHRWWEENCDHASQLERRRRRTRNALMHGGPQAPATVDSVVRYAEIIAVDALQASLDGKLRRHNLIDHFLDRHKRATEMRSRLAAGEAPADVLFPDLQ